MSRITADDCINKIENRYELVLLAAHRARLIGAGAFVRVKKNGHAPAVLALKEIAATAVAGGDLRESLVGSLLRYPPRRTDQERA